MSVPLFIFDKAFPGYFVPGAVNAHPMKTAQWVGRNKGAWSQTWAESQIAHLIVVRHWAQDTHLSKVEGMAMPPATSDCC